MKQPSIRLEISSTAAPIVTAATFVCLMLLQPFRAVGAPSGEQVFRANCAACHAGGGNIVDPTKPVTGSARLASKEKFKAYLAKPSGAMPPFPKIINDAPTLEALYKYCKALK